ncbi:MAG: hypothetical protein HYZ28_04745 [Myxococcales bacterium]|nr:hypothetical protein [Myxococcales bacterium]
MAEKHAEQFSSQSHTEQPYWKRAADEQLARMASMLEEAGRLEGKMFAYGASAIEEASSMMKGSLGKAGELSAEWRRLALEAARRSAEMFPLS